MPAALQAKGGDYLVMAKHNFYTPAYYRSLKALINSWSADGAELTADDVQVWLEMEVQELQEEGASVE